jgi:DNA-binding response OmpR family regulator
MKKILLAEDDMDLGGILRQFLQLSGYTVEWEQDGEKALCFLKSNMADACIIDVMMPKMDGFALAENIIELHPGMPFIFLTARNHKEDRLRGLGLGADDYIVKPFEADELVLRLKNILKRSEQSTASASSIIEIGKYKLDCERLQLHYENSFTRITGLDAKILAYLSENRNTIIKRRDILLAIWNTDDYFTGRSLDVFLSRIRRYLQKDSSISIQSIRNVGFEFRV